MQRPVRLCDEVVTCFRDGEVTLRHSKKPLGITESLQEVGYQGVREGDLVIHDLDAYAGAIGVSDSDGKTTPACAVCQTLHGADARYLALLFRELARNGYLFAAARGVRERVADLLFGNFASLKIPLPPHDEQLAIVKFVGRLDHHLNHLIRSKGRLVELLEEQKATTVHRAVTGSQCGSLNPSDIDWLPLIPSHWTSARMKTVFENLNQRRSPLSAAKRGSMEGEFDFYGASGVIDRLDTYAFDDNLLLIAEDGANLLYRRQPLVVIARGRFSVNNHAHVLKPTFGCLEYWALLLESIDFVPWLTGAAQVKLTQEKLMSIRIPCPPEEEQREIVRYAGLETRGLSAAIQKTKREVGLLKEYRERLVSDLVTGQISCSHK
jgi:type I restriction enzyme S subunit